MIKLSFAVVVAMLCSDYSIAAATTDRSADTAEHTRLAIESGRAYARRDLATLEQFTAQDYVQTDVRGGILNRVIDRGLPADIRGWDVYHSDISHSQVVAARRVGLSIFVTRNDPHRVGP